MNATSRCARRLLYRDFYELFPWFSTHAPKRILPSRSAVAVLNCTSRCVRRTIHIDAQASQEGSFLEIEAIPNATRPLPAACPGCGALTQSVHKNEAGFYSSSRANVRRYTHPQPPEPSKTPEDAVVKSALANIPSELREQLGMDTLESSSEQAHLDNSEPTVPICDRCHTLIHHQAGIPIDHPSLAAIEATIAESPHKYNHVYHVLDAADFPMSLVPALTRHLDFGWIRSRNRRAKTQNWTKGKSGEMSFIITRADLLAPQKEQVDALLPQLREIIREQLGKSGRDLRLGNIRLVSSKRGWWTRDVKRAIWERGGASWLVGKANVGKSNLFEVIYPKGTNDETPNYQAARDEARRSAIRESLNAGGQALSLEDNSTGITNFQPLDMGGKQNPQQDLEFLDTSGLLPPPQPSAKYPTMPIISSLPGTTVSPIRIPFGGGKGELIDLPGLNRHTLEPYVRKENALDIVMKHRIAPERVVIKPGSSLVLGGGLIRITPKSPNIIIMAHAFVPLSTHLTSTQKALELENGVRDIDIPSFLNEEKRGCVRHAGTFKLSTNVTKKFAGPLVRPDDVGLNVNRLPFVVWATDILIEGCGWVEIVAQVRKPRQSTLRRQASNETEQEPWPSPTPPVEEQPDERSQDLDSSWSPVGAIAGPSLDATPDEPEPIPLAKSAVEVADPEPRPKAPIPIFTEQDLASTIPEIEVFSPDGRFIGQRPSLSCWTLGGPIDEKKKGGARAKKRPRKSMKGAKKAEKARRRGERL